MARTKHITAAATNKTTKTAQPKVVKSYNTVGTVNFYRVLNKTTNKMEVKTIYLHMMDGHTYQIDMTKTTDAKRNYAKDIALKEAIIKLGPVALYDQAVIQEVTETVE